MSDIMLAFAKYLQPIVKASDKDELLKKMKKVKKVIND